MRWVAQPKNEPEQCAVHTKKRQLRLQQPVRRATSTSAMPKLTACAAVVASAAPVPMPSPATNHRSSTVFTTVATPMMSSGVRESPTPRSSAESAL